MEAPTPPVEGLGSVSPSVWADNVLRPGRHTRSFPERLRVALRNLVDGGRHEIASPWEATRLKFVFEAHIKAGHTEAEYCEAWERGSAIIQRQPGAQGTRLHRKIGETGVLLAIASWESLAARNAAMEALGEVDANTRNTLDRHETLADIKVIGAFEEPDWAVSPESS